MNTDSPPPYSLDQFNKALDAVLGGSPKADEQAKAEATLSDGLSGDKMMPSITDEVYQLLTQALAVDKVFVNGSNQLAALARNFPIFSWLISGLKTTWDEKQKAFLDLVWDSRNAAVAAKAAADDFAVLVNTKLRDPKLTLAEKKKEIESYQVILSDQQKKAQDVSQRILEVSQWVKSFIASIGTLGDNIISKNEARISELKAQISALEVTVAELDQKIAQVSAQLSITESAGVGAGLLGFLCPVFWFGAAASAIAAAKQRAELDGFQRDRAAAQQDIGNKRNEIAALQLEDSGIVAIRQGLERLVPEGNRIAQLFVAYSKVWAMIAADLGGIEAKLDLANSAEGSYLFNKRLETAAAMYAALSFALQKYTSIIEMDPLFGDRTK